ncbi:MAG: hypothetical protein R3F36_14285 [Candidatus Competibacteraceae bacterium]
MSLPKKQATALHRLLMERFPKAFPRDYDAISPLKLDIDVTSARLRLIQQGAPVDPDLLRRVLANHVGRAGYLLALIHGATADVSTSTAIRPGKWTPWPEARRSDYRRAPETAERGIYLPPAPPSVGEAQRRAKAERIAERERRAAEKQRRREEHERNRQRGIERRAAEARRGRRAAARRGENRPCRRSFTRNGGGSIRRGGDPGGGRNSRRSEDRRARISACGGGS